MNTQQIHFDVPPGEVLELDHLHDQSAGMYPCYYTIRDGKVLVSTSAAELVGHLNDLAMNPSFEPPEFVYIDAAKSTDDGTSPYRLLASTIPSSINAKVPNWIKTRAEMVLGNSSLKQRWSESRETIDERVYRLRPFEYIDAGKREVRFSPDYSISSLDELVSRAADCLIEFVHHTERRYPDHDHVILTGGKDSQMIALVPKLTDNWSVFSAEPNFPVVEKFLTDNRIQADTLYRHTNRNLEDEEDLIEKLLCSDLHADPRHLRWRTELRDIAEERGNCMFWVGTVGDAIFSHNEAYHGKGRDGYFESHFTRAANWQSLSQQTSKNMTGCPMVSPYHSAIFWNRVMKQYDPELFSEGVDVREELGQKIAGRPIEWPDVNPGPDPYEYDCSVDGYKEYVEYVKGLVDGSRTSVITN